MDTGHHLFLDLEDTIITPLVNGWFNTELINLQKIRDVIGEFKPHFIHLFSFAIWNQHELEGFNKSTRQMVEAALGTNLDRVPTVDDHIIPACCRVLNISPSTVNFSDAAAFWGKHEAFRLFCRDTFGRTFKNRGQETEVLLLDDAVIDETFDWPKLGLRGRILNIDEL